MVTSSPGTDPRGVEATAIGDANPSLRARYEVYRRQQGRDLLALLPREGLRALLRTREGRSEGFDGATQDDFEALARRCAELLPLPPFEVWARDFARNRAAYGGPEAPPLAPPAGSDAPVTVAVAEFTSEHGEEWVASLELSAVGPLWAGTVRFHDSLASVTCRTGPILRETHPEEVRARFTGFNRTTLNALLRSALP
ncbi:MAG: hypothetical protein RQ745_03210 [Longimicrobiales bacterium]|nr:hypothetical protein [Longimicrobiales bacterium]